MQLNPYLSFNGDCEEALKFYERLLGGKIEGMSTHASRCRRTGAIKFGSRI